MIFIENISFQFKKALLAIISPEIVVKYFGKDDPHLWLLAAQGRESLCAIMTEGYATKPWMILSAAVAQGKLQTARFLIENGVSVNDGVIGMDALKIAIQEGYIEFAKFLVESGIDFNPDIRFLYFPPHMQSENQNGHRHILSKNQRFLAHRTPLLLSIELGHVEFAKFLIAREGGLWDKVGVYQMTELIDVILKLSSVDDQIEIVELLIENSQWFAFRRELSLYITHSYSEKGNAKFLDFLVDRKMLSVEYNDVGDRTYWDLEHSHSITLDSKSPLDVIMAMIPSEFYMAFRISLEIILEKKELDVSIELIQLVVIIILQLPSADDQIRIVKLLIDNLPLRDYFDLVYIFNKVFFYDMSHSLESYAVLLEFLRDEGMMHIEHNGRGDKIYYDATFEVRRMVINEQPEPVGVKTVLEIKRELLDHNLEKQMDKVKVVTLILSLPSIDEQIHFVAMLLEMLHGPDLYEALDLLKDNAEILEYLVEQQVSVQFYYNGNRIYWSAADYKCEQYVQESLNYGGVGKLNNITPINAEPQSPEEGCLMGNETEITSDHG